VLAVRQCVGMRGWFQVQGIGFADVAAGFGYVCVLLFILHVLVDKLVFECMMGIRYCHVNFN